MTLTGARTNRTRNLWTGTAAFSALVLLGVLVRTTGIGNGELWIGRALQSLRSDALTSVSVFLTDAAQEAVGLAALALAIAILLARHRRWDAVTIFCMAGVSWALALVAKVAVNRPRPPAAHWLLPPDSPFSFPSGHTTTALVIVLIISAALRGTRWRPAVVTTLAVYAVAVAVTRVYLGDHYPTDIFGSLLTVVAAASLVQAALGSKTVRHAAPRVLQAPNFQTETFQSKA